MLIAKIKIVSQMPKEALIKKAKKAIAEKDAVILAEAKQAKTDFLVTLDRKHFLAKSAKNFLKPKKIVTPKMILEEV